jgi:hypothetical protein
VDTKAIVQQVVDVLLKHSPSPAVHLEVLGRRWLALARNESVTNLTSTLLPAKVPAMKKRDKRAREVLELMPVTPDCPQATIALLMSQASTHRSAADIKVLRRCGAAAVKLAEAGLKQRPQADCSLEAGEDVDEEDAQRQKFSCNMLRPQRQTVNPGTYKSFIETRKAQIKVQHVVLCVKGSNRPILM